MMSAKMHSQLKEMQKRILERIQDPKHISHKNKPTQDSQGTKKGQRSDIGQNWKIPISIGKLELENKRKSF